MSIIRSIFKRPRKMLEIYFWHVWLKIPLVQIIYQELEPQQTAGGEEKKCVSFLKSSVHFQFSCLKGRASNLKAKLYNLFHFILDKTFPNFHPDKINLLLTSLKLKSAIDVEGESFLVWIGYSLISGHDGPACHNRLYRNGRKEEQW